MRLEAVEHQIQATVRRALAEDIGSGDVTAALIPEDARASARVICRERAVLCGCAWFDAVFAELDERIQVKWTLRDGDRVQPDQVLCTLNGPARALLTGERAALNLLQTLSGTATRAARYAAAVDGLPVRVLDTRKTLPGLRMEQKYAVRTGGCHNHRIGLYDGILIKENHIAAAGSIAAAVAAARRAGAGRFIEVEVEDLDELRQAIEAGAERIMLDEFAPEALAEAVAIAGGRAALEVSGSLTAERLSGIAALGVDYVSVGALTKHVRAVDLSMRLLA